MVDNKERFRDDEMEIWLDLAGLTCSGAWKLTLNDLPPSTILHHPLPLAIYYQVPLYTALEDNPVEEGISTTMVHQSSIIAPEDAD